MAYFPRDEHGRFQHKIIIIFIRFHSTYVQVGVSSNKYCMMIMMVIMIMIMINDDNTNIQFLFITI